MLTLQVGRPIPQLVVGEILTLGAIQSASLLMIVWGLVERARRGVEAGVAIGSGEPRTKIVIPENRVTA